MNFFLQPLTLLTFFPLLGVLVLLFIPSDRKNALRWIALITTLITFLLSLWVLTHVPIRRTRTCSWWRNTTGSRWPGGPSNTSSASMASASCSSC